MYYDFAIFSCFLSIILMNVPYLATSLVLSQRVCGKVCQYPVLPTGDTLPRV